MVLAHKTFWLPFFPLGVHCYFIISDQGVHSLKHCVPLTYLGVMTLKKPVLYHVVPW